MIEKFKKKNVKKLIGIKKIGKFKVYQKNKYFIKFKKDKKMSNDIHRYKLKI